MTHPIRRRNPHSLTWNMLGALCCVALIRTAGTARAADEAILRHILSEAISAKVKYVRIPPGTYRLKAIDIPGKTKAHLWFDGVKDMEVDGRGVHLMMTEPEYTLVAFHNCARMHVIGITVDCDPLQFTQGTVAAMDPNGGWCDIRIENGYRTDVENFQHPRPMSIFDPHTREFKNGIPDLFLGGLERRDAHTWRIYPVKGVIGRDRFPVKLMAVGDLAVIPLAGGGPAWTCRGCSDMNFEDITLCQAGSIAFHEQGGDGGTILNGCKVLRKPGTDRLLSTNADGFHSKNMHRGPTVENCVFEGMHDDGINIHGMFSRVVEVAGDSVVTAPVFLEWAQLGDHVEFFKCPGGQSLGIFTVRECERTTDPALVDAGKKLWQGSRFGYHFVYKMKLDRTVPAKAGDVMISSDYTGSGFVIRNNVFRNHRYRAMLVRGSNGLIEGNQIYGCTNDAISVTPFFVSEGSFVRNLVIRNNTIRHVGMLPWHRAAIKVTVLSDPQHPITARENKQIVIEGNIIDDVAMDAILVTNADNVKVTDNKISEVGKRQVNGNVPHAIDIEDCQDVEITGNTLTDTAARCAQIVIAASCDQSTIRTKDNKGFTVVRGPEAK